MNLQENDKWTRKEAELSKYKLLKELKEIPKNGWINIFRSEEDFERLEKELEKLIDEEEMKQNYEPTRKHK